MEFSPFAVALTPSADALDAVALDLSPNAMEFLPFAVA